MSDYFGKRGISISVEVFIMKIGQEKYLKHCYLVALDRCEQKMVDTLSIADITLKQFHRDFPQIDKLKIKSDNAGIYVLCFFYCFSFDCYVHF